ncbi:Biopolymer transport protein ExbD [Piscirickettsia salmonis]|uniref:Tol-Pal system protein TolR n=1 Tax=Piscirickettsia salmonis TaxID=1238 RepID=A0A1L6TAD0_PISSA|nr:protein TolR [Piscirickettsia salmonis]AKP73470.1 protein TolR [Piscirickettsia salmonis LF-89 = ATCC VR-1361]ALB22226.1 TolR [Piscirickettsia salmonis]ALY02329.1 protein TolR [Piscirickettsia salmonis]AMA41846.1 protein TolR [Piscirickettsia salmonis]AOS34322.1 protein TolR [Piscirickettsia salmonis]
MARQRRRLMADINVVPYIDVSLVLLIVFMIAAPMLSQGVKVDLPKATANKIPPSKFKPIVISVDQKGDYYMNMTPDNKQVLSAEQLAVWIKASLARTKSTTVYVRADQGVDYGKVVQAMVVAQRAGAGSIGLMTDNARQQKRA